MYMMSFAKYFLLLWCLQMILKIETDFYTILLSAWETSTLIIQRRAGHRYFSTSTSCNLTWKYSWGLRLEIYTVSRNINDLSTVVAGAQFSTGCKRACAATKGSIFVLLVHSEFSKGTSIDAGVLATKQAITYSVTQARRTYCRKFTDVGTVLQVGLLYVRNPRRPIILSHQFSLQLWDKI